MPAPDERNATTVVIEMKPGWIYVKVAEPRPEPERIERLLGLTIDHWFHAHPQFMIDKTQAVTQHGRLEGINVWYHASEQEPEPGVPQDARQPIALTFGVDRQVFELLPKEHIEALVDEALQISLAHKEWHGTLVVISPGRTAVVLDKHVNQGVVLLVESVYPSLETKTRQSVETWLEAPQTRRHVVLIDGSWFMGQTPRSTPGTIVDCGERATNFTLDREPPTADPDGD